MRFNMKKFILGLIVVSILLCISLLLAAIPYYQGIPVLNYHQINDSAHNALTVTTTQFEAQMKYLAKNGYHTITPSELADALENNAALPEKPVLITFDDGYLDNYNNAFPILKRYNMKATIFLITDYVSVYPNYLTWDKALEMQENQIDLESHTLSHVELSKTGSATETLHQLTDSKKAIEWHLKKKVDFLAYPCGSYDDETIALVKDAGYRAAFTVQYGANKPGAQMYALDRIPIFGGNSHTLLRFKLRLNCVPVLSVLNHIRTYMIRNIHPGLAAFIILP